MRILDSLYRHGQAMLDAQSDLLPEEHQWAKQCVETAVTQATRVNVDNVYDYLASLGKDFDRTIFQDDLLCPWETAWYEVSRTIDNVNLAILVQSRRDADGQSTQVIGEMADAGWTSHGWLITCTPFVWMPKSQRVGGPLMSIVIALDENGAICRNRQSQLVIIAQPSGSEGNADLEDDVVKMTVPLVMQTHQFANCRNVELVEVLPTRQIRRARERQGLPVTHHVLTIGPVSQRKVYPKAETAEKINKRLHICRGHRRTYTKERPLFGKYSGSFWVPMHTRGNEGLGRADKSYRVEP